jgi:hypothetical protein
LGALPLKYDIRMMLFSANTLAYFSKLLLMNKACRSLSSVEHIWVPFHSNMILE